jgi:fucose 4-O-acetylase-like acetyltransferase
MERSATQQNLPCLSIASNESGPGFGSKPRRPDHLFIHTVRFWSMVGIVFLHCAGKFFKYLPIPPLENGLIQQPFKFGTIGFFLISGYLLGDRLPNTDALGYVRRRMNRLVPPWLVWYSLQVLYVWHRELSTMAGAALTPRVYASSLFVSLNKCYVETPLWFVPNLVVAITCLVLLRKWLNGLRLGAALLAINLFYGVNVYTGWLPSRHTQALFGFVFYLWLGAWSARRAERIHRWVAAQSVAWLCFWAIVAAAIALVETAILRAHQSPDPLNSLRFSNQIYSVLMAILLIRITRRSWPSFINVGETTYGVYLTHSIVITLLFAAVMPLALAHGRLLSPLDILLMWAVLAPSSYLLSLQLTRALAATRLAWTIGARERERPIETPRSAVPDPPVPELSEA